MRFMFFTALFLIAAVLVAVMLVGIAIRVAVFAAVVVAAIAGGAWVLRKIKGPSRDGVRVLEEVERLPR